MQEKANKLLIVLEMANNHMGDIEHGLKIIREFAVVTKNFSQFDFAFKFQYRDLDTFIHPDFVNRMDLGYIKRFSETKIPDSTFLAFKKEAEKLGFKTLCTPFDEISARKIIEQKFDYMKIASCSVTDWPLLEEIVKYDLPTIISTAGASFEEIDRVVTFFDNRKKHFSIMHCVAEYPTAQKDQQLNTIDVLKKRYQGITIGFSTHENPAIVDNARVAIAKGARIFEKHVGIGNEKYALNAYSATPEQLMKWLQAIDETIIACGDNIADVRPFTDKAKQALIGLRRGVFAAKKITKGEQITLEKMFFAIPGIENQVQANDLSKYTDFIADTDIAPKAPIIIGKNAHKIEKHNQINIIMKKIRSLIKESGVKIPQKIDIEISHHYGIDRFEEVGCALFTFINREYCKKLIISLPGQKHPTQFHKQKEETFHVLHGTLQLELDGVLRECPPGEIVLVQRGVKHAFWSNTGAIIEEISSTHIKDDSFYLDPAIAENKQRKTHISYWFGN